MPTSSPRESLRLRLQIQEGVAFLQGRDVSVQGSAATAGEGIELSIERIEHELQALADLRGALLGSGGAIEGLRRLAED